MSGHETYKGWRNVETWRVQHHITNDEGETFHALNFARWLIRTPLFNNNSSDPDDGTVEDASSRMGVYLRDYVSQAAGSAVSECPWVMLTADVMASCLYRVDWQEIARYWIDRALQEIGGGDSEAVELPEDES